MMRRPIYTVRMIQQDPNYVYSKRLIYIDAEMFYTTHNFSYDQKGRLYRGQYTPMSFLEESGVMIGAGILMSLRDHVDFHSSLLINYTMPVFWDRGQYSMRNMSKYGK